VHIGCMYVSNGKGMHYTDVFCDFVWNGVHRIKACQGDTNILVQSIALLRSGF